MSIASVVAVDLGPGQQGLDFLPLLAYRSLL